MRIGRDNWTLEVTKDWEVVDDPECLTLTLPNGGALQFSSATKRAGQVDHAEIRRVVERLYDGWGSPEAVLHGGFAGLLYSYTDANGVHWRRWFMGQASTLLFVTYNTRQAVPIADERLIDATLGTLRIHSST